MRYAIFSDIHGNLPAWEQVLADIRQSSVDVLICLGDVVGYGPKPQEVLDGIRAVTDHFVLGNHDAAAAGIIDPSIFNEHAHSVILWTRNALNEESLNFLKEVPLKLEASDLLFVHAEVAEPGRFGYIQNEADASESFAVKKHFVTFVGHTHHPECFERFSTGAVRKLGDEDRELNASHRYIINVGSVGEPRNPDDIRARYVIYDDVTRQVSFRKIDFDAKIYRDQLNATSLTHLPYFIRVLEDQVAVVAEVQDMEVLSEAVSRPEVTRRILDFPQGERADEQSDQEAVQVSVQAGNGSRKVWASLIVVMLSLIGGLFYFLQQRGGAEDDQSLAETLPEEGSPKEDLAKKDLAKETPKKDSQKTTVASRKVSAASPVLSIDASRPNTWRNKLSKISKQQPRVLPYKPKNLQVLFFDGRDDLLATKPVLRKGDDTFTYVALFRPTKLGRAQTLFEQAGEEDGARACIQLVKDSFHFNGNNNDSGRLGTLEEGKWNLIAMVLNGKSEDNVIAIHNGFSLVTATIDIEKQRVGNRGFRVGHKMLTNSQFYHGQIAEIEIFDQALSSGQLRNRLMRLKKKWGLKFELQDIPKFPAVE